MKKALCMMIFSLLTSTSWADFKQAKTYVDKGENHEALQELKTCATQEQSRKCDLMLWVINKASKEQTQGKPINQSNYVIKSLAQKGEPDFQYQLAQLYEDGEKGEAQNTQKCLLWYKRSALQNYAPSEFALARIYWFGDLVPKDLKKSFYYTQRAANQVDENFNQAPMLLGLMYQLAMGTKEDKLQAYRWFSIGGLYGNQNALKLKQETAKELKKYQTDMLDKEVKQWVIQHEKMLSKQKDLTLK